uniref:Uncharacterized protein n=1 Tax=Oryza rufipogon TaxID=4529 RepID=A0A0E0MYE2_ORYRU
MESGGRLLRRRQEAYTSTPATYVATSLPSDIVPVQDGYIIAAWRPKPPRRPHLTLLGDIVSMLDNYFVASWRLAPPR